MKATVAANLARARQAAGLTQRELALALGTKTDSSSISRWECGQVFPTIENLARVAEILERDVAWFYTPHDDDEPGDDDDEPSHALAA